ncbi:YqiA/YcfP family alpha/beta fold hydrolase [Chishuiella sp.]|uniref:YqiA/YcfP family alpha/beta fold hydrolase n=1 Tax=Chishuiella sp. TaxID=1969467 RepID=UPI0028ADAB17|nr:YqiA/YcfP family alpha/beta fold hydrolase [Chishuiella sp.]
MKFAYLHGYQGSVTDEKSEYLDSLGDCYKPSIDYDNEPNIVKELIAKFQKEPIDFIAGTSLGGMISYYLGMVLDIPVFMFNPAVIAIERLKPFIPEQLMKGIPKQLNVVFTGLKDDVIDPKLQIAFVDELKGKNAKIEQFFDADMTHLVTLKEFKKAFETFLQIKK